MGKDKVVELRGPEGTKDLLTELLKDGAQKLIKEAVEAEFEGFLGSYQELRLNDSRRQVVRNGYLPEREVQTGVGSVKVQVPRSRNRGEGEIKFTSTLLPPYLRRTKSVEELLPWLYLKGISTNDFSEALHALLGEGADGLSARTISRLKAQWEAERDQWRASDLTKKHYVYLWADGIYCGIRGEDEKLCVLVVLGVNEHGQKELVSLNDGYRESEESWLDVLRDLKTRGLQHDPLLAIGDGALGFWKALPQVFPKTREQRCWQHKTLNVLDKFPKSMRGKVLEALHDIWMAPSRADAMKAWNRFTSAFKDKYPRAVDCLEKDKDSLLTFYDFPAEHWRSIRTTNPIESTFATVRHRSSRAKGCVSRSSMLALVYKLLEAASKSWRRLAGFERLAQVIQGVRFVDGRSELEQEQKTSQGKDEGRLAA
ncbi:MAG: IS256 family transposase [Acidobacteria bacterium]|jgi:putative transposase|nr:IS256 family transposase [Acidobacteriota bacterium]